LQQSSFLSDLRLLNCDRVLKLLLLLSETVKLALLDFAPLVELADLTLNRTFQNLQLLMHLLVTIS